MGGGGSFIPPGQSHAGLVDGHTVTLPTGMRCSRSRELSRGAGPISKGPNLLSEFRRPQPSGPKARDMAGMPY